MQLGSTVVQEQLLWFLDVSDFARLRCVCRGMGLGRRGKDLIEYARQCVDVGLDRERQTLREVLSHVEFQGLQTARLRNTIGNLRAKIRFLETEKADLVCSHEVTVKRLQRQLRRAAESGEEWRRRYMRLACER